MIGTDVAVVDGGVRLGHPAGIVLVGVRTDLSQEVQLQGPALIVPPGEEIQCSETLRKRRNRRLFPAVRAGKGYLM